MDVAEELLDVDHTVDRAHVERRLDDRRMRIDSLFSDIKGWLPIDWSMTDGGVVHIHEDLMMRFGVPQQTLPLKYLLWQGNSVGRIEPRELWIIGANGRVDIVLSDRHYLVIDRAGSFEAPDWQVSSIMARRNRSPLTRDVITQIFDEGSGSDRGDLGQARPCARAGTVGRDTRGKIDGHRSPSHRRSGLSHPVLGTARQRDQRRV